MAYITAASLALVMLVCTAVYGQEKEIPKDSERMSVSGCAKGRTFIASFPSDHEPVRSDVEAGRRFRLSAPKKILDEIKRRELMMIEVTGLVKKSQVSGPGGVAIAGGRIRIGGAMPGAGTDPRRDPLYNQTVMDVESWRVLTEACGSR